MNRKTGSRRKFNLHLLGLLFLLAIAPLRAAEPLHYLAKGKPDAAALLTPPPLPGSAEQAADLAEVVAVHKASKKATDDPAAAMSEKKVSPFSFTPAVGSFFQPGKLPKTEAFLERVVTDTAAAADTAKDIWKRPRPYTVDPTLVAGKLEKSFSYPSKHSTESTVLALLLAELFPDRHEQILATGRDTGWHRVELGRHYPTDIYAGRTFAIAIVREMKSNPAFAQDWAEAQKEIAAAQILANTAPAAAVH